MKYTISLLAFDEHLHQFEKGLHIRCTDGQSKPSTIKDLEVEESGVLYEWMLQFEEWLSEQRKHVIKKGHPLFSSKKALHEFNDKGAQLVEQLRQVLKKNGLDSKMEVEEFRPLYSNIEVGNTPSAWWHIRDKNYGFVVPIQHLPVSDDLKSRLMAWRVHKSKDWKNEDSVSSLNEEGHDLEEHILWELNVRSVKQHDVKHQEQPALTNVS